MKITYIHHSSFRVELDNTILLFDYFKGNLPSFDKNKKLYVFSSHSHHDHFDESIFNLEKTHPNVEYILSNDIKTTKSQNTKFIGANERLLVDNLEDVQMFITTAEVAHKSIFNKDNTTIFNIEKGKVISIQNGGN